MFRVVLFTIHLVTYSSLTRALSLSPLKKYIFRNLTCSLKCVTVSYFFVCLSIFVIVILAIKELHKSPGLCDSFDIRGIFPSQLDILEISQDFSGLISSLSCGYSLFGEVSQFLPGTPSDICVSVAHLALW